MSTSKAELLSLLEPWKQEHLVAFWDGLTADEREGLAAQIRKIDFGLIQRLSAAATTEQDWGALANRGQSPPAVRLNGPEIDRTEAWRGGEELLASGRVGVILVAGGQGTRLGFPHPKGMFPIGPVSGHSLFQIHVEKILARARRYGVSLPLYLMTSPATHDETIQYLEEHDRFGLPDGDLFVFCQGTMPAIDAQKGKVLLEEPGRIFTSPDGHGGMLAALASSGALADLRRRGIEHLFYFQVDNPLVDIAAPEFLGHHLHARSEMTSQVVAKQNPLEKVGNAVLVDGRLRIIEYSDLPDEVARRQTPEGELLIWAGSIAVHAIQVSFLERVAGQADALPYHLARKKVPAVGPDGRTVQPTSPNAIKFERFIFDLLPLADHAIVVEVDPRTAFAPLKNASGELADTPETVRHQLVALHSEWLREAGCMIEPGLAVEISPLWALDSEEVRAKVVQPVGIAEPLFLGADVVLPPKKTGQESWG